MFEISGFYIEQLAGRRQEEVFASFSVGFANATEGLVDSVQLTAMTWNSEPVDFKGRQLATNDLVASYEVSEFDKDGTTLAAFLDGAADRDAFLENVSHSIRAAILADLDLAIWLVATEIARGDSPRLEPVPVAISPVPELNMLPLLVGGGVGVSVIALVERFDIEPFSDFSAK